MIAVGVRGDIGYDDVGTGMPVLFVHGFPHDRTLWAPQLGALVQHSRCIAPDLRGFGESGPWDAGAEASMDAYADDLAALLDALGVGRAVVAGLSMGGYVAFALWRRHRARVRALVLCDTRPGPDDEAVRERRRALVALARTRGSGAVADAMMPGMVGKSSRARCPDLVEDVRTMLARAPADGVARALEAMMARPDSTGLLASIDVPTLVVVGEEDVLTPPAEARAMHAAIAGSTLAVIEGAGHVSNLERPAAFNYLAGEFLGRVSYA